MSDISIFGEDYRMKKEGYTGRARMCNLCTLLFPENMWGYLGLYRHYMLAHEGLSYGLMGPSTQEELECGIL